MGTWEIVRVQNWKSGETRVRKEKNVMRINEFIYPAQKL